MAFPPQFQSLETIAREITGIYLQENGKDDGGQLWLVAGRQALALNAPFFGFNTGGDLESLSPNVGREKIFGKLTDMRRLELPPEFAAASSWRGVRMTATKDAKPKLLLLDGDGLSLAEFDPSSGRAILARSMAWDLIRPPVDRGGEATTLETERLRARFKKIVHATKLKVVGMAVMPEAMSGKVKGKHTLVLATRLPGFPLLQAQCDGENPSQCLITRQCYLEGVKDLAAGAVTGIAISAKRRLILLGDREQDRIIGFRFDSCYHVPRVGVWMLPDRLKKISNVFVDGHDRLWLTTSAADDYYNASAYVWQASQW